MRTTVTLADDVAAEIEKLRRSEGIGISEAVNRLIRQGLENGVKRQPYRHQTSAIGVKVDVTDIGSVLDLLDDN
jgi:metal-responsive CopG/Arc/MetJ family transcriptional regulator